MVFKFLWLASLVKNATVCSAEHPLNGKLYAHIMFGLVSLNLFIVETSVIKPLKLCSAIRLCNKWLVVTLRSPKTDDTIILEKTLFVSLLFKANFTYEFGFFSFCPIFVANLTRKQVFEFLYINTRFQYFKFL